MLQAQIRPPPGSDKVWCQHYPGDKVQDAAWGVGEDWLDIWFSEGKFALDVSSWTSFSLTSQELNTDLINLNLVSNKLYLADTVTIIEQLKS